jgi:mannosyltransferase OCH1-like enzyme
MWGILFFVLALMSVVLVIVLTVPKSASYVNRKVPLTAHFVYGLWDNTPMPQSYADNIEAWRTLGWTIRIWDKSSVNALVQKHYPDLWSFYQNLPRMGQKADWSRYFIVDQLGGFYFDADCQPNPKSNLLQRIHTPLTSFYTFIEATWTEEQGREVARTNPIRKGVPELHGNRLANYAFGCPAKHPAMAKVMALAKKRCDEHPVLHSDYDVLYTTGPDCFTTALHEDSTIIQWEHKSDFIHQCSHSWVQGKTKPKRSSGVN